MSSGSFERMDELDVCFTVPVEEHPSSILLGLYEARVEFLVIGAVAAVLQGVRTTRGDLEIVYGPTHENVARLLSWLRTHDAYRYPAMSSQRLRPTEDALLGGERTALQIDPGRIRVSSFGYDEMLKDTVFVNPTRVDRLIAEAAGVEDRAVLPVVIGPQLG
jgi:hypothetical protein